MKRSFLFIALGLLACACEIPFSIDNISEPRFFVEFIPAAGDQATAIKVAYADAAYDKKPTSFYSLPTNNICVEVNGKRVAPEKMKWDHQGNVWKSSLEGNFEPGDQVSVTVEDNSTPTASASTTIPEQPKITSIDITKSDDKEDSNGRRFVVKLDREVADGEYYGISITLVEDYYTAEFSLMPPSIRIDTLHSSYHTTPGQVATMSDINNMDLDGFASVNYSYGGLVSEGSSYMIDDMMVYSYSPMSLLTSRQFEGNSYSFYVNANFSIGDMFDGIDFGDETDDQSDDYYTDPWEDPYEPEEPEEPEVPESYTMPIGSKCWYKIEVFRLSEELYNYCKAQYLGDYNILSNFGVTPPNFTYSNVRNGLGVVGGISVCASELIPDPFNKEPEMPSFKDLMDMLN
ncbi:MAG: DUF4249 family protein [Bacteroidales bacterium]|nr:DUF4249 family protein [Bacteroidales bacterium]